MSILFPDSWSGAPGVMRFRNVIQAQIGALVETWKVMGKLRVLHACRSQPLTALIRANRLAVVGVASKHDLFKVVESVSSTSLVSPCCICIYVVICMCAWRPAVFSKHFSLFSFVEVGGLACHFKRSISGLSLCSENGRIWSNFYGNPTTGPYKRGRQRLTEG